MQLNLSEYKCLQVNVSNSGWIGRCIEVDNKVCYNVLTIALDRDVFTNNILPSVDTHTQKKNMRACYAHMRPAYRVVIR